VDAGGRSPIPPCWSVASGSALAVAVVFRPGREDVCHGVALLVCRCNACCAGAVDRRYAQERRKCRFFCIDFRLSQEPVRSGVLQAPNTQPAQGGLKQCEVGRVSGRPCPNMPCVCATYALCGPAASEAGPADRSCRVYRRAGARLRSRSSWGQAVRGACVCMVVTPCACSTRQSGAGLTVEDASACIKGRRVYRGPPDVAQGPRHWAPTQWMRVCLLHSHRGCSALGVDAGGRSPIPPCWSVASGGALAVALVFRPGREDGCHGAALFVCRCNACCAGVVDRRYAQERRKCRFFCIDFRLSQKPVRSGLLQAPNTQPAQGGLKQCEVGASGRPCPDMPCVCATYALRGPAASEAGPQTEAAAFTDVRERA